MSQEYYKVWIYIERINEDEDLYEDAAEPASLQYNFSTLERAQDAAMNC